ncbi:hypothetical protein [Dactylosporangium sp. NPDC048998]|uniref:hypothetical protein n=1 Tax=Dactylosporangium sp. NPDC048998 TaxID=3363976 RepID=UPI00371DFCAF
MPASAERLAVEGLTAARALVDAVDPRTAAVHDGEVSVKQPAAELGIPADAVSDWLRPGRAPAPVAAPADAGASPGTPPPRAIYRQKVAASVRLTPPDP